MKKILFFVLTVLIAGAMFAQSAAKGEIPCIDQNARMERGTRAAADWNLFTNFTGTDMDGNTHNIQHYLNQGKYVVIDFFCAWCGPCYSFHSRHTLENLYNTYGQGGTNEFVVLYVECQPDNTAAQISGESVGDTRPTYSAGDFTNGGTNPIPIIDATRSLYNTINVYFDAFPTVALFCPSGYYYGDIYGTYSSSANTIYNFATSTCPTESSLPMVDINVPNRVALGESQLVTSTIVSMSDVLSYQWSFDDGLPSLSTSDRETVTWNTLGNKTINVTVTNEFGVTTATKNVEVYDCSTMVIDEYPFTENFEHGQGCWNFISVDPANDDAFGVLEYDDGMYGAVFNSYNSATDYNQYMISPELDHIGTLTLSFKYKKLTSSGTERFYVKYSTTDAQPSHFTTIGSVITNATTSWKTHTCQVPANAKYIMINYCSNYLYYLVVDDLTLTENIPNYTVTATPDDEEHGSVTGGGSYPLLTEVTLEAIPAEGYVFEKWSDDDATNPRVITVTADVSLTANFAATDTTTTYTLTLNVDENCADMGSVAGAGTYVEGASVQISATPVTGYHFTAWNDENTNNPRTVTMDADKGFAALFAINTYEITVVSDNEDQGTVAGSNTYNYNEIAEISAIPAEHYHLQYWSDGNTETSRSIIVTEDLSLTAYFAVDQYTVTVDVDDPTHGYVTGGGPYMYNTNALIYAVGNIGYGFTQWNDGNTDNPRTVVVTEDVTYTASFEELPQYTITVSANDAAFGTVEGSGTYYEGQIIRISARANEGYIFDEWADGNISNPRTITVVGDAEYIANFIPRTGIENVFDANVDIYPNPTTGIVNIEAEGLNKVVVYDVTGRMVMSVVDESTIDISNLEAGLYFFSVETANGSAMKKLVKE